ncbi:MAG: endopeptidase La [Acholeplasmataceae bacterium]|nr:endopeptidase La [Acholeplasmataceae bacterium]
MFTNQLKTQALLPAMAVRGIVPLPNNEIKLEVGRPESLLALQEASKFNNYIVLLFFTGEAEEPANEENVHKRGVIAQIVYDMPVINNIHKVKLNGIVRCEVRNFVQISPYMHVDVVTLPAETENIDEELAAVRLLIEELKSNSRNLLKSNPELVNTISKGVTADRLSDLLAYNLPFDLNSKLKYLDTSSVNQRLKYMLEDIKKEKYIQDIEQQIENEVRRVISENQKEYYLREKMRVIQDELGDKARKETEIEQLREKILEAKMPKSMEEKALTELDRYSSLSIASGEAGIIRTYLDFIISLPWSKASKDNMDIKKAKEQLDADHYGLDIVKDRILEYLAVRIMTKKNPQAILCLVGPPGVGKTSLAKSIAKALNKKFVKVSLGGVKDESEIRGHRRTYLGALPGRILQGMKRAGVINPVFLLDEIDKLSSDFRGDPASALLEVLDAEQNKFFSDHYLEEPYDLSNVFFICTANYLENIPAPLRDRLEIVQLSSYTEFEKFEIAKRHLVDKQLNLHGLDKERFSISDEAIWIIIRDYTKEAGVRELERLIGALIRKAIKSILMDNLERVDITADNLAHWLGNAKYSYNKTEPVQQIGVVTGLAYTQYGGDTLPVEVTYYRGDGKLVLTGKLGDVMKESAQAALSYVKTNCDKFNIDPEIFKKNDIHIHVPEGAVPKDGPSAGVTIATALISALTKRFVNPKVGMTGEITLRGRVLKIGGIREKAIAAHRSGLETIIIPKENLTDLEEIPEQVRKSLEIISVETVDDVIKRALL